MLILEASLVDVCHCGEYYHRVWLRFSVRVDHREASHTGSEKNHGPPGFLD